MSGEGEVCGYKQDHNHVVCSTTYSYIYEVNVQNDQITDRTEKYAT